MKFIIYICTRIRHGQHPRLPDFQYNEAHGKYIFRGKELDAAEFNEASKLVFSPNYRNNTYSFCPEIIQAVEAPVAADAPPADAPPADAPPADAPPADAPPADAPPADAPPAATTGEPEPDADERKQIGDALSKDETASTETIVAPLNPVPYSLEGDAVFFQGEKIALITNGKIRMNQKYTHLREEVEKFINSTK